MNTVANTPTPGPATPASRRMRNLAILAIALIVAASAAVRDDVVKTGEYSYVDEQFTTAMVKHLETSRSFDTNWKLAAIEPSDFKRPLYNFSGYFLALHVLKETVRALLPRPPHLKEIRELRLYSTAFALAGTVLAGMLGFALGGGIAAIAAALLFTLSPSLLMDGFYARPDSFFTLLCLLLLLVYLHRSRLPQAWLAVAAVLVGFLASIKVSALVFGMLLLPGIAQQRLRGAFIAALGLLLGFAAGAPGALLHPGDYLDGVAFLRGAYARGMPPHGLGPDSAVAGRIAFGTLWLWQTWGLALVLAAIGTGILARRRDWDTLFALAPFAVTAGYFMATPTFIERNLAPALAAFAAVAGLGVEAVARAMRSAAPRIRGVEALAACIVGALMLFIPFVTSAKVIDALRHPFQPRADVLRVGREFGREVVILGYSRPPWHELPAGDAERGAPIIEIHWSYDAPTRAWLEELKAHGWVEISRHESLFTGHVPSSFHTVLDSPMLYFTKGGYSPR